MATGTGTKVGLRWLLRKDIPAVMKIEKASFEFPWTEEELVGCLRTTKCFGMVAELDSKVVGYMLYTLESESLMLNNLAVCPKHRREGIGEALVKKLFKKLAMLGTEPAKYRSIHLPLCETNLDAQLFFKHLGFKAVAVLHDFYDDTDRDAYLMEYAVT